jgi:hypothetical protein
VVSSFLSQSRHFRAEKYFPSLAAGGAPGRNTWSIEEIPDEWVQVKGDEAEQWMMRLELDRIATEETANNGL